MVLGSVDSDWFGWLCIWWFAMFWVLRLRSGAGFGLVCVWWIPGTLVLCELCNIGWCVWYWHLDGVCVFVGWWPFPGLYGVYCCLYLAWMICEFVGFLGLVGGDYSCGGFVTLRLCSRDVVCFSSYLSLRLVTICLVWVFVGWFCYGCVGWICGLWVCFCGLFRRLAFVG